MARVLLLFGGRSAEHEVSCASAVSVHDALEEAGHRVVPVGIDRDGAWFLADPATPPFRAEGRPVELLVPKGVLRVGADEIGIDVVFPVLHGPMGEDGTVQGLFEVCDLPYAGCGVLGSALAMDKDLAKRVVSSAGIPTAPWVTVDRGDWDGDAEAAVASILDSLELPVFVKPSAQGSSIGISKVDHAEELEHAVVRSLRYDDKVVIESAILGREIEVAVLDGPAASEPGEVVLVSGWYTYEAKYADDSSRFEAPANLSAVATKEVRDLAERVFVALGLNGLARIDFFYQTETLQFFFNEANTLPGFTSISGFPKMWLAAGVTYPELCDGLIVAAMDRHTARSNLSVR
jgi:D-alanine-D-alanine ligase